MRHARAVATSASPGRCSSVSGTGLPAGSRAAWDDVDPEDDDVRRGSGVPSASTAGVPLSDAQPPAAGRAPGPLRVADAGEGEPQGGRRRAGRATAAGLPPAGEGELRRRRGLVRGVGLGEQRRRVGVDVVRRAADVDPVEAGGAGVVAEHLQAGGGDARRRTGCAAGEGEQAVQRRGDRGVHRADRAHRADLGGRCEW